jgi:hypothetical protein
LSPLAVGRHKPLAIVEPLRSLRVHERPLITSFGERDVDRDANAVSTALLPSLAIPFVREEISAGRQQERAKPAAATVSLLDVVLVDQAGEAWVPASRREGARIES